MKPLELVLPSGRGPPPLGSSRSTSSAKSTARASKKGRTTKLPSVDRPGSGSGRRPDSAKSTTSSNGDGDLPTLPAVHDDVAASVIERTAEFLQRRSASRSSARNTEKFFKRLRATKKTKSQGKQKRNIHLAQRAHTTRATT